MQHQPKDVTFQVLSSQVQAFIAGGDTVASRAVEFVLDGSATYDPDDAKCGDSCSQFVYEWSCQTNEDPPTSCYEDETVGYGAGATIGTSVVETIPAEQLKLAPSADNDELRLIFTLSVTKDPTLRYPSTTGFASAQAEITVVSHLIYTGAVVFLIVENVVLGDRHDILLNPFNDWDHQLRSEHWILSRHVLKCTAVLWRTKDIDAGTLLNIGTLVPELQAHSRAPLQRERGIPGRSHIERRWPLRRIACRSFVICRANALWAVVPAERPRCNIASSIFRPWPAADATAATVACVVWSV